MNATILKFSSLTTIISVTYSFINPVHSNTDLVTDAVISFENIQMHWLHKQQTQQGALITPFVTDGCSGGLSATWTYLAEKLPGFTDLYGSEPLWHHCCVEHDKSYWQGLTKNGYEQRLIADQTLKTCVQQTGRIESENLSVKFSQPKINIENIFNLSAEMMFQAVRVGGKPCSLLPWRWGYGWPHCSGKSFIKQ